MKLISGKTFSRIVQRHQTKPIRGTAPPAPPRPYATAYFYLTSRQVWVGSMGLGPLENSRSYFRLVIGFSAGRQT